ncbi:ribonuclease J [Candidatus Woesebacteria bacterium]|nr:ribonuclease J [Candidatus Woesebacteria bacterium]
MQTLKMVALGGMGSVTQNMFVYEYEDEILLVDCGIGFPDSYMPGVDVLIPDIRYLLTEIEQGKKIVGLVFSHGHDDHIAAAPYLLQYLPEFPLFGSPLTARFAESRMSDGGLSKTVTVIANTDVVRISDNFSVQLIPVTHSVPDTRHVVIRTPEGIIYHGSDFKLDNNPVDGQKTDEQLIRSIGDEGVLCMNIDCLRVERSERTPSESSVGPSLFKLMQETHGKHIVTLMSSHLHRIQQVIDAAEQLHRKVAFVGRSVEQNVKVALDLNKLHVKPGTLVDKKDMGDIRDSELCVIVAGSQGQEGSSLMRAIFGEHPVLQIKQADTVVFSADVIPGNELAYFAAIDELFRTGVHVQYPDIMPTIHSSGHASLPEQLDVLSWVHPRYVLPIGGADRHRYLFSQAVVEGKHMDNDQVLLPNSGEIIGFSAGNVRSIDQLTLQPQVVDGLGVGDVGPVVLSDRRALSEAGMVVVVLPRMKNEYLLKEMTVVSRGFIFMREAQEVIEFMKQTVAEIVAEQGDALKDDELKKTIERRLARKLYKIIKREPLIVAVILDV